MKTKEEVEKLKADWRYDPIWEIEDTEGFEEHREELIAYRKEMEALWDKQHKEKLEKLANKMGIPGNYVLTAYIDSLEYRIESLIAEVSQMKNRIKTGG